MSELVKLWQDIPTSAWVAIFGAGGVSVVTQVIKKLASLENEKVIQVLFAAVSFAASGLQYLTGSHNIPPTILGLHTAVLVGIGSQWYTHIVKPVDSFLQDVKKFVASSSSKATTDASVAAVNPPADVANEPAQANF